MAVAVQVGSIQTFTGRVDNTTFSLVVSAGSNLGVVVVYTKKGATVGSMGTPTVDGTPMTLASPSGDSAANSLTRVFVLAGVSAGTRSVVCPPASAAGLDGKLTVFAVSGMDQSTIFRTGTLDSSGGAASPRTASISVTDGDLVVGGHSAYLNTALSMAPHTGQTALSAVTRIDADWDGLHTYAAVSATGATSYGMSWSGGSVQVTNVLAILIGAAASGPTINTQPANQTVTQPATATFSVAATTSGGALSYQWQRQPAAGGGYSNISGATSSSYTTGATTVSGGSHNNNDTYRVLVTDSNGSTTSNAATLTVNPPAVTFTSEPLYDGAGLLANQALNHFAWYNDTTGALVLRLTGLSTNASGQVVVANAAFAAATTYRCDWETTDGKRRMPRKATP